MKDRSFLALFMALFCFVLVTGCSSKLSRREAMRQIDDMRQPHPFGSNKIMLPGKVPGFELPKEDTVASSTFELAEHKEYSELATNHDSVSAKSPSNNEYIIETLNKLGYITVQEEGPKTVYFYGTALKYAHSRTIRLTGKMGSSKDTGYSRDFASGFNCYPPPDYHQCNMPPLIVMGQDYKVTGIVQDETHAKVNILIPWKLTTLGSELKPYALDIRKREDSLGFNSDYYNYSELYSWEHLLNNHDDSGMSPAVILFQKFDDGWRIVDANGKSEKDFASGK